MSGDETELSELTTCIGKLICSYLPVSNAAGFSSPRTTTDEGLHVYLLHVGRCGRFQPFGTLGRQDGAISAGISIRYLVYAVAQKSFEALNQLQYALQAVADSATLLPQILDRYSNTLKRQTEMVRVAMHPIESREFFDMWAAFQAPHTPSFVIEAEVLLLRTKQQRLAPPPVASLAGTTPGDNSIASAGMLPSFPTLIEVVPPNGRRGPGFLFNETVQISGRRLPTTDEPQNSFRLRKLGSSVPDLLLDATVISENEIAVALNDSDLTVGAYSLSLLTYESTNGSGAVDLERESNALQFELRPTISFFGDKLSELKPVSPPPTSTSLQVEASDIFSFYVQTTPPLQPGQQIMLFLNDRGFEGVLNGDTAEFQCSGIQPGDYWIRVRVDGLESLLIHIIDGIPAYSSPILKLLKRP